MTMESMSWSSFGLWVTARAGGLAQYLPNFFLRWRYSVPRIREHLTILSPGAGAHIAVAEGQPAHINGIDLVVFNRLPFPIEVDGLHAEIDLGSRIIASFDKVKHIAVAGGEVGRLQFGHDLSDSQAALIRRYPEGQPPSDCVLLRIGGEVTVRTSFRTQTTASESRCRPLCTGGREDGGAA